LRSLGVPAEQVPLDADEASALFRSVTATRCVAVMVDNATTSSEVRALMPASPCCAVVVASRFRLGSLTADGAVFVPLEPLAVEAGARMLAHTLGHHLRDSQFRTRPPRQRHPDEREAGRPAQ